MNVARGAYFESFLDFGNFNEVEAADRAERVAAL